MSLLKSQKVIICLCRYKTLRSYLGVDLEREKEADQIMRELTVTKVIHLPRAIWFGRNKGRGPEKDSRQRHRECRNAKWRARPRTTPRTRKTSGHAKAAPDRQNNTAACPARDSPAESRRTISESSTLRFVQMRLGEGHFVFPWSAMVTQSDSKVTHGRSNVQIECRYSP